MGPENPRDELAARISALIRATTGSEAVTESIAAAWADLQRPLAVLDRAGAPLARVPRGDRGRAAVAAGLAIVHGQDVPPPAGCSR